MKIHYYTEQFDDLKDTVLTVGSFDGLHLGHVEILEKMVSVAKKNGLQTCLITFNPHPREILKKSGSIDLLTSRKQKNDLLEKAGLEHLVVVPFNLEFANISASEYVEQFLVPRFQPRVIIIGHDHRFGKDQKGDVKLLRNLGIKWGFEVEEMKPKCIEDEIISSTKIRKLLKAGDVHKAQSMLGRPFEISGKVIHGQKLGRNLGFPTANLLLEDDKQIIPKLGIYAVKAKIHGSTFKGMLYIGYRPTVTDNKALSIEVHIFNFNQNIYDSIVSLLFIGFIREDEHFEKLDDLKTKMAFDREIALKMLSN
ncbi:MAG: hypothetical protein RLZZ248_1369 [Bacteroidota bacterium]